MLKDIKEGQQPTPTILKRQPDAPWQTPAKHCGICSCNSYHTDECPQLQEDNTVASTHNFFEGTTIPPYNKKHYTQGWWDNQPTHCSPLNNNRIKTDNNTLPFSFRINKIKDINHRIFAPTLLRILHYPIMMKLCAPINKKVGS
ncbi:hypothetical protein PIB30_059800 [Stylosanthes scabra]|uniref:Uncharacterized protein n=1 Tax=Stylosanthes scabra TaxID=79078 RepID=A0ABU6YJ01_9FABA|nr:hypothetical protein [Stylosanthes scabra]